MSITDLSFQTLHSLSAIRGAALSTLTSALFLITPGSLLAQSASIEGTDEGAAVMMDDWVSKYNANSLANAYGGDSTLNHGYKRTPILFDNCDASGKNCRRKYPKVRQVTGGMVDNVPDFRRLVQKGDYIDADPRSKVTSLSTDDEITRATMAVYQPLHQIKNGVAEDVRKRDYYLDLFKTIRGVANLTLSYLDKTVAAGLATTESQVNEETQNLLLKQISWTNSRISNPQRSQIYVDADEKMQACLNTADGVTSGEGPQMGTGRFSDMNASSCTSECGVMPSESALRYGWCVCCVQNPGHATISAAVVGIDSKNPDKWSLVDRYFHGTTVLSGDDASPVLDFSKFIKEMYGDIVVDKNGYHFIWPEFTVSDKIRVLREGCGSAGGGACSGGVCTGGGGSSYGSKSGGQGYGPTGGSSTTGIKSSGQPCSPPASPSSGASTLVCPFTGMTASIGVRKSMLHVLRMKDAPWDGYTTDEKRTWIEASMGTLLTPAIKKAVLLLQDGTEEPLGCDEQPDGKLSRWLLNFADVSAVSAFEKLHSRTRALLVDHDALNLRMTPNDRRMFWTLISRVDSQLDLAKADTRSDQAAVMAVTDASIGRSRKKEQDMAAAIEANIASQNMAEAIAGTARFGDITDICTGTTC